ncbi:furin-like protease 2 [Drosophila elegans]|uniref:furin-like protease 2 n=1 Tax=Drosophila elegans TaxID=30023 RepID=UPI001BC82E57|nr:furin-like protease 2 [Drosophila elegans]
MYYFSISECTATSTGGKRRTIVGSGRASFKSSAAKQEAFGSDGDGNGNGRGEFVLRLDSPLTAITAIAVAICLLIITIFSIIFAVLQRNSNHVSRNSVRYRKIANTSSSRRKNLSAKPTSDARFIFNIGEDEDTEGDNSEDELDDNVGTDINRTVYDRKGKDHGHEFYIESTNDIDAIEFHCKGAQKADFRPRRCNEIGHDDIHSNANTNTNTNTNTNMDSNPSTSRTNIRS